MMLDFRNDSVVVSVDTTRTGQLSKFYNLFENSPLSSVLFIEETNV